MPGGYQMTTNCTWVYNVLCLQNSTGLRVCSLQTQRWVVKEQRGKSSSVVALPQAYGNLTLFLGAVFPEMWCWMGKRDFRKRHRKSWSKHLITRNEKKLRNKRIWQWDALRVGSGHKRWAPTNICWLNRRVNTPIVLHKYFWDRVNKSVEWQIFQFIKQHLPYRYHKVNIFWSVNISWKNIFLWSA